MHQDGANHRIRSHITCALPGQFYTPAHVLFVDRHLSCQKYEITFAIVKVPGKTCFVRNISYLKFMKAKKTTSTIPEPTKSEMEILQVLWKHGPSTVRFVNDYLRDNVRPVQYTSTLKLMRIM